MFFLLTMVPNLLGVVSPTRHYEYSFCQEFQSNTACTLALWHNRTESSDVIQSKFFLHFLLVLLGFPSCENFLPIINCSISFSIPMCSLFSFLIGLPSYMNLMVVIRWSRESLNSFSFQKTKCLSSAIWRIRKTVRKKHQLQMQMS